MQQAHPGRQPHASLTLAAAGTVAAEGAQQPLPCQASPFLEATTDNETPNQDQANHRRAPDRPISDTTPRNVRPTPVQQRSPTPTERPETTATSVTDCEQDTLLRKHRSNVPHLRAESPPGENLGRMSGAGERVGRIDCVTRHTPERRGKSHSRRPEAS